MRNQTEAKGVSCNKFTSGDTSFTEDLLDEDSSNEDLSDEDLLDEDSSNEDLSDEDLSDENLSEENSSDESFDEGSGVRSDLLAKAVETNLRLIRSLIQAGKDLNEKESQRGTTLIYQAIAMKNLPLIEEMVSHGANLNVKASDGLTPLAIAIQTRRFDIVSRLLDLGADIQLRLPDDDTVLHRAAECGCPDMIKLFIERGLDVNVLNCYKETPLHSAAKLGEPEAAKMLLANGADVNTGACTVMKELPGEEGKLGSNVTPIFLAAAFNSAPVVKILIEAGADVNAKTSLMYTPLHPAAQEGYFEIVQMLLEAKIDVNVRSEAGRTALNLAAKHGQVKIVKALLNVEDIDVNPCGIFGDTPLISAALLGNLEIVKLLIAKGAPINGAGLLGHTPLQSAFFQEKKDVAEWLIKHGGDFKSSGIWTLLFKPPLHFAVEKGWVGIVESLVTNTDINVNEQADNGETPLLLAATSGNLAITMILLSNGADPNIVGGNGQTPLYMAASKGYDKIVEQLIMHGANVNIAGRKDEEVPLFCAVRSNNVPMATLFLGKGGNINVQNGKNLTPLHIATGNGYHKMTELLLKYGGDINVQEKRDGCTPLFLAVKLEHQNIVETLLEYGANVNLANRFGVMPIHIAARALNKDMVRVLLCHGAYYNLEVRALNCCGAPLRFAHEGKDMELISMLEQIKKLLSVSVKKDVHEIKSCLKAGAIINARNAEGMTAMYYAVNCGDMDAINLLLEHNADIELATNKGNRPLDIAVAKNNEELVLTLLRHCKKLNFCKRNRVINAQTAEGVTALHIAAEKNNLRITQLLLASGAVYNIKNNVGKTPLSLSKDEAIQRILLSVEKFFKVVKEGSDLVENVRQILEGNETVLNARDSSGGGTPLYWSCAKGHTAIAEFLLDQGVDCCLVTNKGTSPLHIAVSKGHTRIVRAILNRVASDDSAKAVKLVNTVTPAYTAPLHLVSNKEVACCLLQRGAMYTLKNRENKSALDLAQKEDLRKLLQITHQLFENTIKGDPRVMNNLESLTVDEFKAVIGARNEKGQTLLQVAEINDHVELANDLKEKISCQISS